MDKKVPVVRFKGFTDDWEQRKLGQTKTHFTDGNYGESYPSSKDMSDKNNGVPFLRGSDFINGYLDVSNAQYINKEKHAELVSGHIENDDIVLAVRGSLGTIGYATKVNIGWNINSQLAIIRTDKNEILGMFLTQYLLGNKGQKEILSRNTGTALKQLPIKQLKDIPVPKTSIEEQKKIGGFFKLLDETITLQERKLELLMKQKQAYLQKMFPKQNEKVPELRFNGFTDDWEQRKLGEELDLLKDGTHGTHKDVERGSYLLSAKNIKNGKIIISTEERMISKEEFYTIHKNFSLEKGDILLTIVGSIGESALMTTATDITFQRSVAYLRPTSIVSQFLFILTMTQNFQRELKNRQVVSAQPGIYLGDLAKILISFPKLSKEQSKIGDFFKQLDEAITLQEREVENMKMMKKSLLQKMFI